jgi:hypothetical protein
LPGGLVAGDTLDFVKYNTSFTAKDGNQFILKNTYQYTLTSDDISQGTGNANWSKTISYGVSTEGSEDEIEVDEYGEIESDQLVPIEILQGQLKTEIIYGSTNSQVGQIFQKYHLTDKTFGNIYGDQDYSYDEESGIVYGTGFLTKIGVGPDQNTAFQLANLFMIDRRSIINPRYVSVTSTSTSIPKLACIKTSLDEGVDVIFGDDKFAEVGARSTQDNIYIQYLSVVGAKSNKTGVIGTELKSSNTFLTGNGVDLTGNIKFYFNSNVINGSDMESLESIRQGAPSIYNSLDRLVTKADYVSYLKTLTFGDGKEIKNAISWGEQEENLADGNFANFKYFNCTFFSVLASLYDFPSDGVYNALAYEDLHEAYLEEEEDFVYTSASTWSWFPEQSYFYVFVAEQPQGEISRVNDYRYLNPISPINYVYEKVNERSQTTVRNIYISPIVQQMKLVGDVRIGRFEDRASVKTKINNALYEYLDVNADFNVDISISRLHSIIMSYPEVISCSVRFEPVTYDRQITEWIYDNDIASSSVSGALITILDTEIAKFVTSAGGVDDLDKLKVNEEFEISLPGSTDGIWGSALEWIPHYFRIRTAGANVEISERNFYRILMKNIYDAMIAYGGEVATWARGDEFKKVMYKMHNDMVGIIRQNMIDENGDITNFSIGHEIAQVSSELNYVFATNSRY